MSAFPIVDAHQHFWDLQRNHYPWLSDAPPANFRYGDTAPLRRNYLPQDYRADCAAHRVVASVHMEAEWDPRDPVGETRWLAELRRTTGWPTAAVGQAWFDREDIAQVLAGHAEYDFVRGVRQKPKTAASPAAVVAGAPGTMSDPRWRDGYALLERHGLSYDLQAPWWHMGEAAALARDFPRTPIVINHTALPADRSAEALAGWRSALETIATQPNVSLKISGLGIRRERWSAGRNAAIVRDAIRIFGADRCMFASNFPVDGLVGSFDTIFTGFKAIVADMPEHEQRMLFHDNAMRVYRLEIAGGCIARTGGAGAPER
jgi:predicted TIM-barrel fold metal-dependent hydrolase